ncbi:MAG: tetratricopeptide repeat protein [Sideroxydans sp.]|jgi:tetratricopeptide (TPR) repeat protein
MAILKKFTLTTALCALISFSSLSFADDVQDANKLFKQGQNAQALEKVNTFLATKPKDAQARFLKGLIVNEQGNTTEAISIFTALTDDYPELPEPYNNLAVLYASQSQYEKAKIALEMAIRTHPSYATAHENLGDIYAKMASQAYDRALQLDKSNTSTQTKLALIRDLFSKTPRTTKPSAVATVSAPTETPSAVATTSPTSPPAATTAPATVASKPIVVAAAPAPTVVAKAPVKAEPIVDVSAEVLKATREWAAAWSSQKSDKYLAFYAKDFITPDGMSRSAWEAQRKERIAKPASIKVEVQDAKVKEQDNKHASVSFKQSYRASHLKTSSSKVLVWVKNDGHWQITEERSAK